MAWRSTLCISSLTVAILPIAAAAEQPASVTSYDRAATAEAAAGNFVLGELGSLTLGAAGH
jgi:hypothetical protein